MRVTSLLHILQGADLSGVQVPPKGSAVTALRHRVGADAIVAALANTLGTMVMPLQEQSPITLGAPLELLARRRVIPLGRVIEGGVRYAVVGMSDPTDDAAVRELVSAIGMPARRVLVHDDDLTRALLAMERQATPNYRSIEAPPAVDLDEGPTQMDFGAPPGVASSSDDDDLPFVSAVGASTDVHLGHTVENSSSVFTHSPPASDDSFETPTRPAPAMTTRAPTTTSSSSPASPSLPPLPGVDLEEGPTTRIEVPRVMLVMSGGGADDVVDAVVKHVPGILVHRDPSDTAVLADTSRIAVFVEVPGAPFSHGVLEGLLWRRQQLIVVSSDVSLDQIDGVTRVEPDKSSGKDGLVGAIIRGIFGLPSTP